MTIKSLLIGSAAAVVAASSAQAADAVIAADPEPVEYVQVCQDFGTGYFYIPGTETCLKIGGLVRAEWLYTNVAANATNAKAENNNVRSFFELTLDAKSSTEIGTVAGSLVLEGDRQTIDSPIGNGATSAIAIAKAHISIGDGNVLNIGYNDSIADVSIGGEQVFDATGSKNNQIQYKVAMDSATFYVQAVATQDAGAIAGDVAARLDFTAGDISVVTFVGYDGDGQASGNRIGASIQASYMGFGAYYQWSQKANAGSFGTGYRNVFGGSYSFNPTDKLAVAVGAEFADGFANVAASDAWAATLDATYTIVDGLAANVLVTYTDFNAASGLRDATGVRLRLTRSF